MNRLLHIIYIVSSLALLSLPAEAALSDSITARVVERGDSIELCVTAYDIETQLAFLMQGLKVRIEQQPDTLLFSFPSAQMVRHKVKRHPNEVKAQTEQRHHQPIGRDTVHHVMRPDVQPLVAALCDTTASLTHKGNTCSWQAFSIDVDREAAIIAFSVRLPTAHLHSQTDCLTITLLTAPSTNQDRAEYTGRRLSNETPRQPDGLGEGMKQGDAAVRTLCKTLIVKRDVSRDKTYRPRAT